MTFSDDYYVIHYLQFVKNTSFRCPYILSRILLNINAYFVIRKQQSSCFLGFVNRVVNKTKQKKQVKTSYVINIFEIDLRIFLAYVAEMFYQQYF